MSLKTHLIVYRADDMKRLCNRINKGAVEGWSGTKQCSDGDLILIYIGTPLQSIVAVGFIDGDGEPSEGSFSWTDRKRVTLCNYKPVWWLNNSIHLPTACDNPLLGDWYRTKPYRNSREIKPEIAEAIVSHIIQENSELLKRLRQRGVRVKARSGPSASPKMRAYTEGSIREITAETTYRDPQLRSDAIRTKGYKCQICGFEFGKVYGELGQGYIEVHHLRALSERRGTKVKTKLNDVAVVCANCHRMLHRNGAKPMPIQELRKIVQKQKRRR